MKQKIIKTQFQLNRLKEVKADEVVIINAELKLNGILRVYGRLEIRKNLDCNRYQNRYVEAFANSTVEAFNNSTVYAYENSTVEAFNNSTVEAYKNSTVYAYKNSTVEAFNNSTVEAYANSTVYAYKNSTVEAYDNSTVKAYDNSTVKAYKNSTVYAYGNSTVKAYDYAVIRVYSQIKLSMFGFSVALIFNNLKLKIDKQSKYIKVQQIKQLDWFENNGVKKTKKIIVYKRVSKDFKTQEGSEKETLYEIGKTITHPNWRPRDDECGEGKFHACSRPFFADQFRDGKDDRYIAIEVDLKDLYEWKDNPKHPHKIAFRKGKVLYECDREGKKIDK
jgi:hypothetical protein